MLITIIFYISIFLVFYTYIGYGLLIYLILIIKRRFKQNKETEDIDNIIPEVTLFIAAYNEDYVVEEKMKNCYEIDYPKDKLKILWITDGSNDKTNELLKQYENITLLFQPERKGKTAAINRGMKFVNTPITVFTDSSNDKTNELLKQYENITLLFQPERKGKTAAINRGMKFVNTPITVFTDANTFINSSSIKDIINSFNNKNVGCVACEKRINNNSRENNAAKNESLYWKYESKLKQMDSELNSTIGAAGELYAIRTSLFEEMPDNTLLDDFILSMRIAMKGYIILYCEKAYAIENGSANINEERKRKIRIAAGGIQSIIMLKELLNIFKYKLLSFQYISHRVLRWSITPLCLLLIIPINIYLVAKYENIIYILVLIAQIIFYLCGIIGWYYSIKSNKNKLISIPYYFLFMNLNVIKGFFYLKNKKNNDGTWEKSKRA